ncbi:MAG: outer membrane beta-barrel protein [Nitrospirales bacterium]
MLQDKKTFINLIVMALILLPTLSHAEWYVGGQFGFSRPNDLADVEGIKSAKGITLNDQDLKNAFGYGAKVGYFFQDRFDWLGIEFETFTSNPHIKQQPVTASVGGSSITLNSVAGTHFRVITPAVNLIVRFPGYYVEPYAGGGVGAFIGTLSSSSGSDTDYSPGVNALGGLRFYLNDQVALFTEYKYNYTKFQFDESFIKGTYSSHNLYGGISFHF